VVSALAAAHEAGVVHRDVNPANLLVSSFGHVKVGDFGIAGLVRGSGLMTRIHALTLAYASPEELDGEAEVGTAADVFSLAATLSHLSSGERPSFSRRGEFTAPWGGDSRLIDLTAVMGACLATKPADRPTVLELTRVFDRTTLRLGDERIDRLSDVEGKTIVRPRQVVDRGSPSSPSRPPQPVVSSAANAPDDGTPTDSQGRRRRIGLMVVGALAATGIAVVVNSRDPR
jgi:serine/threonine protein kinase